MKVAGIRSYSMVNFAGQNANKKANTAKTAAGAAMIAFAVAAPAQEADAQIFYPPVPPVHRYYVPASPVGVTVPECFVYGDMENYDYEKSMNQVFSEIDAQVNPNRELSVNEVVKMERKNWNLNNFNPYNAAQMERTAAQFRSLSEIYNEKDSNPKTISYSEYKTIMKDYMQTKKVTDFMMLMELLTRPRRHCPIHGPHVPLPPPNQHHHHHR